MRVFILFASPDERSLLSSLKNYAVQHLEAAGHEVRVSDLYAMRWKAVADAEDFPSRDSSERLHYALESGKAYSAGTQCPDVIAEQAKLEWCDVTLFMFNLWWFHMPAIMKGWVDRVYAYGFSYGRGPVTPGHFFDRYGEGVVAGKRCMVICLAGTSAEHYSPRAINGSIHDLLFPIQHNLFFFIGFQVLPPLVQYRADRTSDEEYAELTARLAQRLNTLETTEPIPYRFQNHGDYEIPSLQLKEGVEKPGTAGYAMHIA